MRLAAHPAARKWVYGISLAIVPLLVAYGIIREETAPLWVSLVSAVLVPSLALANTPAATAPTRGSPDSLE